LKIGQQLAKLWARVSLLLTNGLDYTKRRLSQKEPTVRVSGERILKILRIYFAQVALESEKLSKVRRRI